jgi:hypothetical protein
LDARVLVVLTALVGAGSLQFHTFATVWAGWFDDLFILAFIYVFLSRFLARVPGWTWIGQVAGLVAYSVLARALVSPFPQESLNGSYKYLPALLGIAALAGWAWRVKYGAAARLAAAVPLFLVALAFRTIDQQFCDVWPVGTHWLWHALVAVVLYLVVTGLAPRAPRPGVA